MKTLVTAAALALTFAATATADTTPLPHDRGLLANGLTLQGINLQGISLQGINLQGISLQGINLQGMRINGVNLQGFRVNGTKFQGLTQQGLQGEADAVLTSANPFAGLDAAPLGQ